MFWGLIMEPKRRYTQKVKHPFHISMAALDIFSADDEPTQLMLYFEERNYLLCTLQKGQTVQCPLDLNFEAGEDVVFATNGHSNIHLSGFLQDELDEYLEAQDDEDQDEDEQIETRSKKRKGKPEKTENQSPLKKSKLAQLLNETFDSSDDDESFVVPEQEEEEADSSDEEEAAAEESDEEDDEDMEEEDDEDEGSDAVFSSLSEDEEEDVKPKHNGVVSKKKNKKNLQKAQQSEESPKKANKMPKVEKNLTIEKSPSKNKQEKGQKLDKAQIGNKTPKGEKTSKGNKTPNAEGKAPVAQSPSQKRSLEGGVLVQDLKVGQGESVKPGKMVVVHYEGRLKQNNKVFDQNSKGSGFKFRLGKQEVIKGWDVGVNGMKIGGKRRIICPPNMAYGNRGSPPVIPPNSTLIFEVELKNIL